MKTTDHHNIKTHDKSCKRVTSSNSCRWNWKTKTAFQIKRKL